MTGCIDCYVDLDFTCDGTTCEPTCGNDSEDTHDGQFTLLSIPEVCDETVDTTNCISCNSVEPGYVCGFGAGACVLECSNGVVDAGEDCDDGNLDNYDGCDEFCSFEDGFLTADNLSFTRACGNAAQDFGVLGFGTEQCDI
jgi:cysteine-rich repeat protein